MSIWNTIGLVCVLILIPIWGYVTIYLLRNIRSQREFRRQLGLGFDETRRVVRWTVLNYGNMIRNRRYLRIFSENPNLKPDKRYPHAKVKASDRYHAAHKGFHPWKLDPGTFWAYIADERYPEHWQRFKILIRENPDFPRGDLWLWGVYYA